MIPLGKEGKPRTVLVGILVQREIYVIVVVVPLVPVPAYVTVEDIQVKGGLPCGNPDMTDNDYLPFSGEAESTLVIAGIDVELDENIHLIPARNEICCGNCPDKITDNKNDN